MKTLETALHSVNTIVFFSIALMSFAYLVISSFFGGDHDHDADSGHDGSHDASGAHEFTTVSFFSPKVMCIFMLAFGAAGGIASVYGLSVPWCVVVGFLTGFGSGLIALYALRILYAQQANSLVTDAKIVGSTGQVVTRIPSQGVGEVTFIASGQSLTRLARSVDGNEILTGKSVMIRSISGDAIIVQPV